MLLVFRRPAGGRLGFDMKYVLANRFLIQRSDCVCGRDRFMWKAWVLPGSEQGLVPVAGSRATSAGGRPAHQTGPPALCCRRVRAGHGESSSLLPSCGKQASGPLQNGSRLALNPISGAGSVLQVQFGMCSSANPVVLLRLFPSLAPEELLSPVLHLFAGALRPACMC